MPKNIKYVEAMGHIIAQKGGVGKSTIARMIAREVEAADGYRAKVADMDTSQVTNLNWSKRRASNGYEPAIDVQSFSSVPQAMKSADRADIFIFDGAPHTTKVTKEIAQVSDLIVIPTGATRDDLDPAINLARELEDSGTTRNKIIFVLSRLGTKGGLEEKNARAFLRSTSDATLTGPSSRRKIIKSPSQCPKIARSPTSSGRCRIQRSCGKTVSRGLRARRGRRFLRRPAR